MRETTDVHVSAPPEWWERLAAVPATWLGARPGLAAAVRRVRAISLWVALPVIVAMLVLVPSVRGSVRAYVGSYVLLGVWFLLVRTKTVSWAGTTRMFVTSVAWTAAIGWITWRLATALGLSLASDGSGTALAGFLEEAGKLLPLLVLAVLAPGRVRRFAAGDWAVLGFACGIGFNAHEDALRQVSALQEMFWWGDPAKAYSFNPWASAEFVSPDGVSISPGHHIWTVTGAMAIGLGIALWRTRRVLLRVAAIALPVSLVLWQIADHASFNANNSYPSWPEVPAPGFPAVLSGLWSLGGHGRFIEAASVILLVACLLVDAHRRHRAALLAPGTPDKVRLGGAISDSEPGQRVLGWSMRALGPQAAAGHGARVRRAVRAAGTIVIRALSQWAADVGVVLAAHARKAGEGRGAAVMRGHMMTVHVRQIRTEAMTLTTPGTEPAARRRFALVAAITGTLAVTVCVMWGALMATAIGRYLQLEGDLYYLGGVLDGAGDWWNGLSGWQQVAVGAGLAALVVLSGGSIGLALGVSGVATYGLVHAHGAATFTRDPVAATRSYVATTTPMEALLDTGEFALTFAPGNFAGAAAGRAVRIIGEDIASNPTGWLAARQPLHDTLPSDAGIVALGAFMRREPLALADGTTQPALSAAEEATQLARYNALPSADVGRTAPRDSSSATCTATTSGSSARPTEPRSTPTASPRHTGRLATPS